MSPSTHGDAVKFYGAVLATSVFVYFVFSNGDFSFILTLSSLISMLSFALVVIRIEASKSVTGVSRRSFELYLLITLGRLLAIVPHEGYLPNDASGDYFYQLCEGATFLLAGTIVYQARSRFPETYEEAHDRFVHYWLAGGSAVLAVVLHPSLNQNVLTDIAWAFALNLEAVAALPQLVLFHRGKQVLDWTAHFLAAQAVAKLIVFYFWFSSYEELATPGHPIKQWVGYWVMLMQVAQLVLMGDFIYHYARCLKSGLKMDQILSGGVVDVV